MIEVVKSSFWYILTSTSICNYKMLSRLHLILLCLCALYCVDKLSFEIYKWGIYPGCSLTTSTHQHFSSVAVMDTSVAGTNYITDMAIEQTHMGVSVSVIPTHQGVSFSVSTVTSILVLVDRAIGYVQSFICSGVFDLMWDCNDVWVLFLNKLEMAINI